MNSQYKTPASALNALKRITKHRCYKTLEEQRSPGEVWLVSELSRMWIARDKRQQYKSSPGPGPLTAYKWGKQKEVKYREMKSIARGLGLWDLNYIKVLVRLGQVPEKIEQHEKHKAILKIPGMVPIEIDSCVITPNEDIF